MSTFIAFHSFLSLILSFLVFPLFPACLPACWNAKWCWFVWTDATFTRNPRNCERKAMVGFDSARPPS